MTDAAPARLVPRGGSGWPARFEHLATPPDAIWVRGALPPATMPAVAVVGSRRATPGGLLCAREIGSQLAAAGIAVVSGLARGIDGAAHLGALDGAGVTVAVLGCGIDVCYPRQHRVLRDAIVDRGCVLSEDGGDAAPEPWRFPRRNRLIAALVEAIVVVEATAKSGALSTARWAADLGREVLALPGSIRNPSSHGTNLLIRDGVRPYLEFGDLFDAVPALRRALVTGSPSGPPGPPGAAPGDDPVLAAIVDGLGADPVHPDELGAALGLATPVLMAALGALRLRGAVTDVSGGRVARTF